jgi:hypothetical protein
MHPIITQAIVAERTREIQAYAASAGRARWIRQARRSGHMRLFQATDGAGHGQISRPVAGPRRDPRAA